VFFGRLPAHGYDAAFRATVPWIVGAYAVCAGLCFLLPRTAVTDETAIDAM